MTVKQTVIVTGASQGIGAAIVQAFLGRGYNVAATARRFGDSGFAASAELALVEGDVTDVATAEKVREVAIGQFGSIDHVVNDAGLYKSKPFTDFTMEEMHSFLAVNLEGFVYMTQMAVRQMLAQGTGGSVTTITAALADNPVAGVPASIPMMTKGGLNAITLSLASEYAKQHIRFNAVAPGVVESPLHKGQTTDAMESRSPMGTASAPKDIAEAVVYLTEASHVTGEVLHVDDGSHVGRW